EQRVADRLVADSLVRYVNARLGQFRTMTKSLVDQILGRYDRFLTRQLHGGSRHDLSVSKFGVDQRPAKRVFHQQLLQFEIRPSNRDSLLVCGNRTLGPDDFNRRESANLYLFLGVGQCLLRESERLLRDSTVFVREYQVPVHVFDLGDCRYSLQAKGYVRNFAVVLRNANKTGIRGKAQTLQESLCELKTEVGIQRRTKRVKWAVSGDTRVVESQREIRAPLKSLQITEVGGAAILDGTAERTGALDTIVVDGDRAGEHRIKAGDGGPQAQGCADQPGETCTSAR